jgi:hypothetical protein
MSLCVGLCCKNSAQGFPAVLKNLDKMRALFPEMTVVFCYDISSDQTLALLAEYIKIHTSATLIPNHYPPTAHRTTNIANARNSLLTHMRHHSTNFFAMMDANEYACIGEMETSVLAEVLLPENIEKWDAVSFDREAGYYDHWALSFENFIYSFFHCQDWQKVVENLRREFPLLLEQARAAQEFLPVYSAYNGFALYKTAKFLDCQYSSTILLNLFPVAELVKQMRFNKCQLAQNLQNDCEHRRFHLEAIQKHQSKIRIYPKSLFKKIEPRIPNLRGPA